MITLCESMHLPYVCCCMLLSLDPMTWFSTQKSIILHKDIFFTSALDHSNQTTQGPSMLQLVRTYAIINHSKMPPPPPLPVQWPSLTFGYPCSTAFISQEELRISLKSIWFSSSLVIMKLPLLIFPGLSPFSIGVNTNPQLWSSTHFLCALALGPPTFNLTVYSEVMYP